MSDDTNVTNSKVVPIRSKSGKEYIFYEDTDLEVKERLTDGSELGVINKDFKNVYKPRRIGLTNLGTPEEIEIELAKVGYFCMPFYASQLALVLNNPTPSVRTLMLEGPSGCGKSFMAKSLAKITGADFMCLSCFKGMNLDHLIEKPSTMAMIHQMSGKENISDEVIWNACNVVGIDHFIKTLPNGIDSQVGDNEAISSGQKQLLTISRGMIEDAPFLILDEATSNVDTRTEELVQKAMDKLTEGRTSFIIAHRLSTIKNADLILVMKDGNIVEQGDHEKLMKKKGFYADLYNSQFEL